ncbi:MAG: glycosyltransferase family 1 protein [Acidobacteria bacterium]|nr:glycosyltransferase family 1 protein [Acidobacteriota bacterium]
MDSGKNSSDFDLVCFSHLRWDFVYQRPQHLLSRFARERRVFFIEEPIFVDEKTNLNITRREDNLFVVVPHISHSDREISNVEEIQREFIDQLFRQQNIKYFVAWFYTPMALTFTAHLQPQAVVYDCMDELSGFKFAPPDLIANEAKLFQKADLVFTGGQSLYEAKKSQHKNVHAFPSSIDAEHFRQARSIKAEPEDQKQIPHPKLGYCGVIDERMDVVLLAEMADLRPTWQFVMIGPVIKISDEDLPRRENIHYLGGKNYQDLPAYLANWDVALMPFALNESTKFISPTKTPEYLAAGKPVVSTPIRDVVRPYGEMNLVHIARTAEEFIAACENAMQENAVERLKKADEFLAQTSWDKTWTQMANLINEKIVKSAKVSVI